MKKRKGKFASANKRLLTICGISLVVLAVLIVVAISVSVNLNLTVDGGGAPIRLVYGKDTFQQPAAVATANGESVDVEVSGTGCYGSTITGEAVSLEGKPYGGGVLTSAGSLSLTVSVTDSRGRVGTAAYTITVAAYAAPSLSLSASRCTANGTADDTGDCARITVTGFVTQVNGRNTGDLTLTYGGTEVKASLGTGNVSYQTDPVYADPNATLSITAMLEDKLVAASRTMVLSTGYATLDLLAGGKGISFGKAATREGFDCAMPAYFSGGLYGIAPDESIEWLNPPMYPGIEYRTMERYYGKPVYAKLVDYYLDGISDFSGNPLDIEIPHGISGFGSLVRCNAKCANYSIPELTVNGGTSVHKVDESNITLRIINSAWTGLLEFSLYYTKA